MIAEALLKAGALRTRELTVAGQTVVVREPSALDNVEQRFILRPDGDKSPPPNLELQRKGLAYLVWQCVLDTDGRQVFTQEQAAEIVGGNNEVALPIISAITGFTSKAEKKSLPASSASNTDSPSP